MRILPIFQGALLCFFVSLLFAAIFCYGDGKTVEVAGIGECADCAESNIKTDQAFSGLHVTIDCKPENGEFERRGAGELDEEGKFKVNLSSDIVEDGKLKEECYAQLHSASGTPCPAHNGLESSKIVFKSESNEKHTFGLAGKLEFSPVTCTSAFLRPHFKYPPVAKLPPLPKWKLPPSKNFPALPPKVFPPGPPLVFPPPVPIHKKSLPPPVPVYKKPFPPIPPKVYPPFSPMVFPPPVPIYKKPLPPPVPVYKKPPIPKLPPFKKPYYPPLPKSPPKVFHHPKFGKWPPLPPLSPIH